MRQYRPRRGSYNSVSELDLWEKLDTEGGCPFCSAAVAYLDDGPLEVGYQTSTIVYECGSSYKYLRKETVQSELCKLRIENEKLKDAVERLTQEREYWARMWKPLRDENEKLMVEVYRDYWGEFDCLHPDAEELDCDGCKYLACSDCKKAQK